LPQFSKVTRPNPLLLRQANFQLLKSRFVSLLAAFAAGITACTYEPEGDYFKEVEQTMDPTALISLNEITAETITLYKSTTFSYEFSAERADFKGLQIFWDEMSLIGVNPYSGGLLTIPANLFTTGTHKLRIFVVAGSGTGSLADVSGVEEREIWKEWTVIVDVTPPPVPNLTFTTENGLLKASWPAHQHPNFVDYQLRIQFSRPYYPFSFDSTITFTDPSQNFFVNPWYVGKYAMTYQVLSHSQSHTVISQPTYVQDGNVEFTGEIRYSDSTVLLKWSKATYPAAFKKYKLSGSDGSVVAITNIADTSLRVKPQKVLFNLPIRYDLLVEAISHYSPAPINYYADPNPVQHSKIFPYRPDIFEVNITHNRIAGRHRFSFPLRLYDYNFQKVDSLSQWSSSMPYEGDYMYYTDREKIFQKHLGTGQVTEHGIISSGTIASPPLVAISGSSSNQLVVYAYWLAGNTRRVNVHNLATGQLVSEFNVNPANAESYRLSSSGNYLLAANTVYEYVGSVATFRWTVQSGAYGIGFLPDDQEQILLMTNQGLTLNNSADGSLIRTISGPAGYVYTNYDVVTHSAFLTQSGSDVSYAIDILTLEQTAVHARSSTSVAPVLYAGHYFEWAGDFAKVFP
jgi:hypothetical protein